MNIQDWGAIGEIVGALAVVASLIYLAVQIRQNTRQISLGLESTNPRDGEPDLILITEHPNWAAFDLSNEYFEKLAEKLQGSFDNARNANIDRGALRRLCGQSVYQEVKFKN